MYQVYMYILVHQGDRREAILLLLRYYNQDVRFMPDWNTHIYDRLSEGKTTSSYFRPKRDHAVHLFPERLRWVSVLKYGPSVRLYIDWTMRSTFLTDARRDETNQCHLCTEV